MNSQKIAVLHEHSPDLPTVDLLIGESRAMKKVASAIDDVARSTASVVIAGESGTGKELVARTIHEKSSRRRGVYVALNCAAIPEMLMESEIFGHERGAFTGADYRRIGCFEIARGGTLLLDEITEMKVGLQAKLLRVLEERRIRRVGGSAEIEVDVRVVAATNRDPEQAVREGKLRQDLIYRLNVFTIHLPPLHERIEDLPLLIARFVQHYSVQNNKHIVAVDQEGLAALRSYRWPGNVRQLRNVIERAVILCEGSTIGKRELPDEFQSIQPLVSEYLQVKIGTPLHAIEMEAILRTIEFTKGNRMQAAQILHVSPRTLYNKLRQYRRIIAENGREPLEEPFEPEALIVDES